MRCPKCGYISFDHMENCRKCGKDISGSSEVSGTTYHAQAPSFLRIPGRNTAVEEDEPELLVEGDADESSFEFSDPDLDVLSTESDDFVFTDSDDVEGVISLDEGSIEIGEDEFQLETDEEFELDIEEGQVSPEFAVPDELSDISDLAPPSPKTDADMLELSLDEDLDADTSLDLDGLDLDLGLGDDTQNELDVESLSLDDIDLSEEEIGTEDSDLDGLDLDLDLGGMDEDLDSKKKESSSSLDSLSLSLD